MCEVTDNNKYERNEIHKRKLKKLAKETANDSFAPAIPQTKDRKLTHDPDDTAYVKRYYRSQQSSYLKKKAAKKFRQYKDDIGNGCGYKKIFDLWWELY